MSTSEVLYGTVAGAPELPPRFADVFTSGYATVNGVRLHHVTGGDGPPLLLLGGWPQTWYQWRFLMPELAENFSVVTLDPRGFGLSDKPENGYDSGTLAEDAVALMRELGHERFAMVAHDIGMWTGYALAADHPEVLERIVLADAIVPGLAESPPLIGSKEGAELLYHFAFNRARDVNERLVEGREEIYFGHQFVTKAATPTSIPEHAVQVYVEPIKNDPSALRATFEYYRAIETIIEQNRVRKQRKLTLPVLTIAGARSTGGGLGAEARIAAEDVTSVVLPGVGHFVPEEDPEGMLAAMRSFLAEYRAAA